MKKLLAVLMTVCLCLGSAGVCASAVSAMAESRQKTTLFVQFEGDPVLQSEVKGLSEETAIKQTEETQKNAIQSVQSAVDSTEVLYTYTHALNGIAVEATKRDAAVLRDTPGVAKVIDLSGVHPVREAVAQGDALASGSMIGADVMHALGYDGAGTAVAVIDGGMQWNHETMRLTDESTAKFTKADIADVIRSTSLHAEGVTADAAYKSAKVPFAFDYCDGDTEVAQDASHGTHVSGIAAGNSASLRGIAPEAQVLMFRINVVDNELFLATLLAAIDDASKFDIASMNMSVGLDYEMPNDPAHALLCEAVDNARASGILVCAAAGNSGAYDQNTLNPDNGTNGIPNSIPSATSVASIDNMNMLKAKYTVEKFIYDGDKSIGVIDAASNFPPEGALVPVDRKGNSDDLTGKIALLYDTTVSEDDYSSALSGKAMKAVIVPESLYGVALELYWMEDIPTAVISDLDAYRLLHSKSLYVTAEFIYYYTEGADQLQNSFFTSYGVSEDLKLTVDLAAPGDPILSGVSGGGYGIMGGTSMACPHVTGAAALMREYLDKNYPDLSAAERANLMENLLMSTADPISTVSPRIMGAGIVNLGDAAKAKAVLTDRDGHSALNVGGGIDDSFKLSFTITNVSDETVRYDQLDLDVITDDYTSQKSFDAFTGETTELHYINGKSVPLKYTITQSDMPRSIVLQPGEKRVVTMTVSLDSAELADKAAVFSNGFYVEGYLHLSALSGEAVELTVPFMGFRGDWLQAPAMDVLNYYGFEACYVIRNLRSLTIELVDPDGHVAASTQQEWVKKDTGFWEDDVSNLFDADTVPDGTYTVRFTGLLDAEGAAQKPQVFSFEKPFVLDRVAPRILKVDSAKQSDGTYTLEITVDSEDVEYFALNGRRVTNAKYVDYYPTDEYVRKNADGSVVYAISGIAHPDRNLVIYAVDGVGNSTQYHQYSIFLRILRWIRDTASKMRGRLMLLIVGLIARMIGDDVYLF